MTMTIMLTGTLARQPEQRTSKNGNPYCLASVRVQAAEGDLYTNITAFGDLADTLARLAKGDPVTIIGTGKLSTYQGKEGDTKAGLSITVSRIIALTDHQAPPRPRTERREDRRQYQPAGPRDLVPDPFQDKVPF